MMTATLESSQGIAPESVRLTEMAEQLDFITAELREQQRVRESATALVHDLAPVSAAVMSRLTSELADLDGAITLDDVGKLAKTLALNVNRLNALLAQLESMAALTSALNELAGPAMSMATEKLQEFDNKGYFAFARQGAAIADHVVTSFSEDDVKALGDNVVLILQTVKEMTQPEVMTMMRRTAITAQGVDDSYAEPPSTIALLKQMRDPEVRRGLARTLNILRTLGSETSANLAIATKKD